jgi:hypothetical protein
VELLDRTTYRMYSDASLQEMARYNPSAELAIVLAERLEELQFEFDHMEEKYVDKIEDLTRDILNLTEDLHIAEGLKA